MLSPLPSLLSSHDASVGSWVVLSALDSELLHILLEILLISLLFLTFLLWEACYTMINSGPREESHENHLNKQEEDLNNTFIHVS